MYNFVLLVLCFKIINLSNENEGSKWLDYIWNMCVCWTDDFCHDSEFVQPQHNFFQEQPLVFGRKRQFGRRFRFRNIERDWSFSFQKTFQHIVCRVPAGSHILDEFVIWHFMLSLEFMQTVYPRGRVFEMRYDSSGNSACIYHSPFAQQTSVNN